MIVLLLTLILLHPTESLDDWVNEWGHRIQDEGLSSFRLAEYVDMAERHPIYFGREDHPPPPVTSHHHHAAPAPTQPKPPPEPVWSGGVEQWRPLVEKYFPASEVALAMKVMSCESGGNPTAQNPGSQKASGLFQHLPKYWTSRSTLAGWAGADIFAGEANIAVAAWLLADSGWKNWRACL